MSLSFKVETQHACAGDEGDGSFWVFLPHTYCDDFYGACQAHVGENCWASMSCASCKHYCATSVEVAHNILCATLTTLQPDVTPPVS